MSVCVCCAASVCVMRRWRLPLVVLGAAVALTLLLFGVVRGQTPMVTVTQDGFTLSCPANATEGASIECTLTNGNDAAADWPVVGILHLSTDDDRALVVGAPIDVAFGTQTPSATLDDGVWWIGDTLVGYSRFDWSGTAPAATTDDDTDARTISVSVTDDTAWEAAESFYVTLGPNDSKGVGFLYDNKQKVTIAQSDSKSSDATLTRLQIAVASGPTDLMPPPTTSHALNVGHVITELTLTPTASYKPSEIEVVASHGGTETQRFTLDSDEESQAVFLSIGTTTVTVEVTAENGTGSQTYTLAVTRADRASETEDVSVTTGSFKLVCPGVVSEGDTLTCRLTNTSRSAASWPVVAFLHSSADASRALIAEDPIIPDTSANYRKDLSLDDPQTPAVSNYYYGYGELFSGGSRAEYITYGYEKFEWSGNAAGNASRDVTLTVPDDAVPEGTEIIYAALAPSDYSGLSSLVDNKVPIIISDSDRPTITGDATVSVAESSSTAVRSYTATVEGGGTVTWSLTGDRQRRFRDQQQRRADLRDRPGLRGTHRHRHQQRVLRHRQGIRRHSGGDARCHRHGHQRGRRSDDHWRRDGVGGREQQHRGRQLHRRRRRRRNRHMVADRHRQRRLRDQQQRRADLRDSPGLRGTHRHWHQQRVLRHPQGNRRHRHHSGGDARCHRHGHQRGRRSDDHWRRDGVGGREQQHRGPQLHRRRRRRRNRHMVADRHRQRRLRDQQQQRRADLRDSPGLRGTHRH